MITPGLTPNDDTILETAAVDFSGSLTAGAEAALNTAASTTWNDTAGHTATSTYVMDRAGAYLLIPAIILTNQNANTDGYVIVQVNGVTIARADGYIKGSGGVWNGGGVPQVRSLAIGDTITMRGFHSDTGNTRVVAGRVAIVRIG